jgi:hypothetical protein
MEVQETKKHLAGVLLSPHDGGQADDSLGGLNVSFGTNICPGSANMFLPPEITSFALAIFLDDTKGIKLS